MRMRLTLPYSLSSEDWVKGLLIAGYVGIVIVCFTTDFGPRIFWTMALPILILSIVLMGFNTWRRICPLAFWGTFGVRFKPKKTKVRRVPEWMERWFFVISLAFLVIMLVARLVLINGDGRILGFTLIGIASLAFLTNLSFSGRTWCNFICPVGTVERIYTDPNSLRTGRNSQCVKCTACKRHCPDIDHENAYWKDVTLASRRIAFYGFPGVVFGFYAYYYLRAGDWEAYFDGRWTHTLVSLDLVFGPGFFFAPAVPALIAAVLTLVGFAAVSYAVFLVLERLMLRHNKDEERVRHLTLSLAGFAAFNVFYLFAGAPTLRLIPNGTRAVAFIAPLVSGIYLYKRWRRKSEDYVKVKSARHLLPLWKSKMPPPEDPAEIFAFFQGQQEAHAAQVSAYEEVVRGMLGDQIVRQKDLNLLSQMRANLNITETEHRNIFAVLSDEQRGLFDPMHAITVERRLQLQGYRSALTTLLMQPASEEELAVLRQDYGIDPQVHEAVLRDLRGEPAILMERAQHRIERLTRLRLAMSALRPFRRDSIRVAFVMDLLQHMQDQYLTLTIRSLAPLGDRDIQKDLVQLMDDNAEIRATAWERIRPLLRADLAGLLGTVLAQPIPGPLTGDVNYFHNALNDLVSSPDVYQRAGAALLLGHQKSVPVESLLRTCLADLSELVRETAIFTATAPDNHIDMELIEALASDSKDRVREAAQTILNRRTTTTPSMVLRAAAGPFARLPAFEKMLHLHQVPLFANLDAEDLDQLSKIAQEIELHAGDLLVREGDVADELYLITDGNAQVVVERNGAPQIIDSIGPGAIIGELAVIDAQPRSATVRAATPDLHLLRIGGEDFRRMLAARPDLSSRVVRMISSRLRQALGSA